MFKTPIFKGSCTAIVTPFNENGIDYDKMAELIDFQYDSGTTAIVVCGTTGENATMSRYEHEELIEALGFARCALRCDADGVLMVTPYYNKATQIGLIKHFTYVADRVDIPMIVYNVPSRTSVGIKLDTYIELSKHPNINGVKEASGDFSLFAATRAECGNDLFIWSGNDDNTVPMMALGALGVISVASNVVPAAVAKLCELCLDGNFLQAQQLYFKYSRLFSDLFIETNPIPVKAVMKMIGFDCGKLRLPLTEITPEHMQRLAESMRSCGIGIRNAD